MIPHVHKLQVGDSTFDPSTRRLWVAGAERRLSPKATDVLLALAETPGRVWSRDALLERVWPNVIVVEEVLTHAIAELRRELGDDSRHPAIIETIPKSGYRLIGSVSAAAGEMAPAERATDSTDWDVGSYLDCLEAARLFEAGGRVATESALARLEQAISTTPDMAAAHARASTVLAFLGLYYGWGADGLRRAREHSSTARRLAPENPQSIAAEALVRAMLGETVAAQRLFMKSIRTKPDCAETHHWFARASFAEFDSSTAAVLFERAAELRRDDFHSRMLAGVAREFLGQDDRARLNFSLALPLIEDRIAIAPSEFRPLAAKAHCLVGLGRVDEALEVVHSISEREDRFEYYLACTFARARDIDRSLSLLEEAAENGWSHLSWLHRDPNLNILRGMPRFQKLERSVAARSRSIRH